MNIMFYNENRYFLGWPETNIWAKTKILVGFIRTRPHSVGSANILNLRISLIHALSPCSTWSLIWRQQCFCFSRRNGQVIPHFYFICKKNYGNKSCKIYFINFGNKTTQRQHYKHHNLVKNKTTSLHPVVVHLAYKHAWKILLVWQLRRMPILLPYGMISHTSSFPMCGLSVRHSFGSGECQGSFCSLLSQQNTSCKNIRCIFVWGDVAGWNKLHNKKLWCSANLACCHFFPKLNY